jgi:hypothetical protein
MKRNDVIEAFDKALCLLCNSIREAVSRDGFDILSLILFSYFALRSTWFQFNAFMTSKVSGFVRKLTTKASNIIF